MLDIIIYLNCFGLFFFLKQMSIFSLLIDENENLKVLRSLRTLRALRPLRAISRWQGMRVSTKIFNVTSNVIQYAFILSITR